MPHPTAHEVLAIALINRARLDPLAEAARFGIDLNEGLAAGRITADSKQPLAFSDALTNSAHAHSQAMIDRDFFDHFDPQTGLGPSERAEAAGYSGLLGENIAFRSSSGAISATVQVPLEHRDLFVDEDIPGRGHRLNILDDRYKQVGVGVATGQFNPFGNGALNSVVMTQDFGIPSGGQFLTGLTFSDFDANGFYSIDEGRFGVSVTTSNGTVQSQTAGNYAQAVSAGAHTVTFAGAGLPAPVSLQINVAAGRNVMLSLIGASTVETSVSLTAVAGVGGIIGLGTFGLTLTGMGGSQTIFGTKAGDTIDGGRGVDRMEGKGGGDVYVVDHARDEVIEAANGGFDEVFSAATFTLGANIENLTLTGTKVIDGTGNDLGNVISGNNAANVLDGKGGADRMVGKRGDDTYVVDHASDKTVEVFDAGVDRVFSSVSHKLGNHMENLFLTGGDNIGGTGNELANLLGGNFGNNLLNGGVGTDTLNGGLGNDTLTGGANADVFVFDSRLDAVANVDAITDFVIGQDKIHLDNAVFKRFEDGAINPNAFKLGAAGDANDRLLYDASSGALSYDADGNGAALAVRFATVSPGLALTAGDFLVI